MLRCYAIYPTFPFQLRGNTYQGIGHFTLKSTELQANHHNRIFIVSSPTIWISSLFIGIMASIPKFLTLNIKPWDLLLDGVIAMLFSIFVWYLNLYLFPPYSARLVVPAKFISKNLGISLLMGIPVMAALTMLYRLFPMNFDFQTIVIMWESRGFIINLTISLFLYLFYQAHMNKMISIELEKIRADNLSTQFELLKQQVNPHFLFNSLNTLISMINMQDKKAAHFVVMLSEFYRSTLEKKKQDRVSVREELTVLQAYRFLLEARFEEALVISISIDERHMHSLIPPFTLQILVENCIKHNIVSLEESLYVKVYSDQSYIIVENNLQPKRSPEPSTGTGLNNIVERYLTSLHAKVEIIKDKKFFRIKLPVKYEDIDFKR
jgi:two-component system, LytTR family, sensor kinase